MPAASNTVRFDAVKTRSEPDFLGEKNTMKIAIRTLAVALALTGAVASAHTRTADVKPTRATSIVPVPACPPDDPNACGL